MKIGIIGPRITNESRENLVFGIREIGKIIDWRQVTHIVSGGAIGGDTLARMICKALQEKGYPVELEEYIPDWYPNGQYNSYAGFQRNDDIVFHSQYIFALINPNGTMNGTRDTLIKARGQGRETYELIVPDQTINPRYKKKGYKK